MNKYFMDLAFKNAEIAYNFDEVPIGAVIVKENKVIAQSFNKKEKNQCVLAHAELFVIDEASKLLGNWRLENCDIYVTLDPCPMCASAIKQARIKNVYSALSNSDPKLNDLINSIFESDNTNPSINFISNLDPRRSKELLNKFFKKQRNK